MKKRIDEFQSFAIDTSKIKGGVKCPTYLMSHVRSKSPEQIRQIVSRLQEYSPESAAAVATAAE
jgi:hypothetical protein